MTGPALALPLSPLSASPSTSVPQKMIGIALCAVGVVERIGKMVEGEQGKYGGHMFTQNTAKGYRLPISINSSGLASLDASGGWGQCYPCVSSPLAVCRAKTEADKNKKKRTGHLNFHLA